MRTNSVDRVYSITIRVDSNASTRSTICVVAIVAVQAMHIIYYESLNDNLKLVLLTQVSKRNSDP